MGGECFLVITINRRWIGHLVAVDPGRSEVYSRTTYHHVGISPASQQSRGEAGTALSQTPKLPHHATGRDHQTRVVMADHTLIPILYTVRRSRWRTLIAGCSDDVTLACPPMRSTCALSRYPEPRRRVRYAKYPRCQYFVYPLPGTRNKPSCVNRMRKPAVDSNRVADPRSHNRGTLRSLCPSVAFTLLVGRDPPCSPR